MELVKKFVEMGLNLLSLAMTITQFLGMGVQQNAKFKITGHVRVVLPIHKTDV